MNLNVSSPFSLVRYEPGPLFGGEMEIKRPRVLLAGISISLLGAYYKLLCEEFEIVGTSADGRALMATAILLQPNVIVVDLALSPLTDVNTRLELKKLIPQTKFLVLTNQEDLGADWRQSASGLLVSC